MPSAPVFCCDLCHPTYTQFPLATNVRSKPLRRTQKHNPKVFTMGDNEMHFCDALIELRKQLAAERLGRGSFISPQTLLSKSFLDHIVALAHDRKISTLEALRDQITWGFVDSYGAQIIELVKEHYPPLLSSPFTTAPLQPHTAAAASSAASASGSPTSGSHARAKGRCGICGATDGHNSASSLFMICIALSLIIIKNGLANPLKPLLCEQQKRTKRRNCIVSQPIPTAMFCV